LAVWSADEVADDWFRGITPAQIVRKAINRIEAKGHRGVLLLHDIHPATAMALPELLKELKARGYHVVQAVPAGERPKSVPERPAPMVAESGGWPRVVKASLHSGDRATKTAHHRKRVAHNDGDPVVNASMSKKRQKTKTAESSFGWNWFQR